MLQPQGKDKKSEGRLDLFFHMSHPKFSSLYALARKPLSWCYSRYVTLWIQGSDTFKKRYD